MRKIRYIETGKLVVEAEGYEFLYECLGLRLVIARHKDMWKATEFASGRLVCGVYEKTRTEMIDFACKFLDSLSPGKVYQSIASAIDAGQSLSGINPDLRREIEEARTVIKLLARFAKAGA